MLSIQVSLDSFQWGLFDGENPLFSALSEWQLALPLPLLPETAAKYFLLAKYEVYLSIHLYQNLAHYFHGQPSSCTKVCSLLGLRLFIFIKPALQGNHWEKNDRDTLYCSCPVSLSCTMARHSQGLCVSPLVCAGGSEIHLLQLHLSLCSRLLHKSSITSQHWHSSPRLTEVSRSDFSPIPAPVAWFPLDSPLDSVAFHFSCWVTACSGREWGFTQPCALCMPAADPMFRANPALVSDQDASGVSVSNSFHSQWSLLAAWVQGTVPPGKDSLQEDVQSHRHLFSWNAVIFVALEVICVSVGCHNSTQWHRCKISSQTCSCFNCARAKSFFSPLSGTSFHRWLHSSS